MVAIVLASDPHLVRPHVRNQDIIFIQNEADIVQHLLRCRREARVVIITRVVGHHHLSDLHSPFRFPGVRTNATERIKRRGNITNDFFVGLIEFVHMVRRFVDVNNHLVAIWIPLGRRIFHNVIAHSNHEISLFHDNVREIPLRHTDAAHEILFTRRNHALRHHGADHGNLGRRNK